MRTLRRVSELRTALREPRASGRTIGLVPTMGAFHAGHLSLMDRAREECDEVVVSLFVNPTQFNEAADLSAYPRDEARDLALAADAGVNLLFAPPPAEIYPEGFATTVSVAALAENFEGAHRGRSHFDGVATVVTKLLNIVAPDVAFFGQKDAQQTLVIRRLVRDLDLPSRIEVCPTVRDPDGLALSSRNVRLSAEDRRRAPALYRALRAVAAAFDAGESEAALALGAGYRELRAEGIEPEYLELVSADTLEPLEELDRNALVLVAARLGGTRLIDNLPIDVPSPRVGAAVGTTSREL